MRSAWSLNLERQVEGSSAPTVAATPSVPSVSLEAQSRAESLRLKKAELESLDRQLAFREREQERLKQVLAEYQRRLESTPGVESEWIALTRDYETLNDTYKTLLLKSEDSAMTGDLEKRRISEQFRILDAARVPVGQWARCGSRSTRSASELASSSVLPLSA